MPRSRDLLARFRASGTPGAPAAVGVPADHIAERAAELEPVFQRLTETEEEARRIRDNADRDAARRRSAAAERSRALITSARREAAAEHADAAAKIRKQIEAAAAQTLAQAAEEAAEIRARGRERLPEYVDRVMDQVRADLEDFVGGGRP